MRIVSAILLTCAITTMWSAEVVAPAVPVDAAAADAAAHAAVAKAQAEAKAKAQAEAKAASDADAAAKQEARVLRQLEIKMLFKKNTREAILDIYKLVKGGNFATYLDTDLNTQAYMAAAILNNADYLHPYYLWRIKQRMVELKVLESDNELAQEAYLRISKMEEVKPTYLATMVAMRERMTQDIAKAKAAAAQRATAQRDAASDNDRRGTLDRDIAWETDKLREAEQRDRRTGLASDSINTSNLRSKLQDLKRSRQELGNATATQTAGRVSTSGIWYDDSLIANEAANMQWFADEIAFEQARLNALAKPAAPTP